MYADSSVQYVCLHADIQPVQASSWGSLPVELLTDLCSCRRIDNRLNIMEGILSNRWFIVIQVIIIGGQILIIFLGGKAFSVQRLDQPSQWAVSVLLGSLAVPVGVMIRLIPDKVISKPILYIWHRARGSELRVSGKSRHNGRDLTLEEICDQLAFMKKVRGGRLRHIIHNHPQVFSGSSHPPCPSTLPMPAEDTPASDNFTGGYSTSPPASERTPLIHGSGTSQSQSQV